MSSAIVALLATALFEAAQPDGDPVALDRTLSLLARAVEGAPLTLTVDEAGLRLNDMPCAAGTPGSRRVVEALRSHHTGRVQFPAGMEPRHWREVATIYTTPAGIHPTAGHLRDALRGNMPLLELWETGDGYGTVLVPTASAVPGRNANENAVTSRGGDLSNFSAELARLQTEGRDSAEQGDAPTVARILLRFAELEQGETSGQAAIVAKERRRVVPPATLEWLVVEAARAQAAPQIADALITLGSEIVEPVLDEIARHPGLGGRDALMAMLDRLPDLTTALNAALRESSPSLILGGAMVAERRHLDALVPALGTHLRHPDADVRAAVWRALEAIGTREAFEMLNTRAR